MVADVLGQLVADLQQSVVGPDPLVRGEVRVLGRLPELGEEHGAERVLLVEEIRGRDVLVLDDILDEGHTMLAIRDKVLAMGAASFRCAVFANKLIGKDKPIYADYVGLDLPNRIVFGFGMDLRGVWRNLPAVYAVK